MDRKKRGTLRRIACASAGLWFLSQTPSIPAQTDEEVIEAAEEYKEDAAETLLRVVNKLPDEHERLEYVKESSDKIDDVVPSAFEEHDSAGPEQMEDLADPTLQVIETINDEMELSLPSSYLERASDFTKLLPVVNSVLEFLAATDEISDEYESSESFAEAMQERDEELNEYEIPAPVERFYISLLLIGVELALIPSSVGYRTSFVATRYTANHGLVRIRQILGLEIYAVVLSGVHWSFRGTIEGAISYIVRSTDELSSTFNETAQFTVEEVSEAELEKYEFLDTASKDNWDFSFWDDDEEDSFIADLETYLTDERGLIDGDEPKDEDDNILSQIQSILDSLD